MQLLTELFEPLVAPWTLQPLRSQARKEALQSRPLLPRQRRKRAAGLGGRHCGGRHCVRLQGVGRTGARAVALDQAAARAAQQRQHRGAQLSIDL